MSEYKIIKVKRETHEAVTRAWHRYCLSHGWITLQDFNDLVMLAGLEREDLSQSFRETIQTK